MFFFNFCPRNSGFFLSFSMMSRFFSDSFNLLPKSWRGENWLKSRGIPLAVSGIAEAEQNACISFSSLGLQWLSGECIVLSLSLCRLDAKFLESEKKKKEDKIKIARLKRLAGVVDANFLFRFIDHFKVLINNLQWVFDLALPDLQLEETDWQLCPRLQCHGWI